MVDVSERAKHVRQMAAEGMSDIEIGYELGISRKQVYNIRNEHGILHGRASRDPQPKPPEVPEPVIEPELVYEENGVTVRRYPARYAETLAWGKVVR